MLGVIVLRLRDVGLAIQRNVAGIESGNLPLVVVEEEAALVANLFPKDAVV